MKILLILISISSTLVSFSAHADYIGPNASGLNLSYHCNVTDGNGTEQDLVLNDKEVTLTSTDKMNGMSFKAAFDFNYHPKGNLNKVRFNGTENGNSRGVILYKQMLAGSPSGIMQIRGTEDSYWSANYNCTRTK